MGGPVTLGDLIETKKLLWIYCWDCGHEPWTQPRYRCLGDPSAVNRDAHEMLGLRLSQDQHQALALPRRRDRDASQS